MRPARAPARSSHAESRLYIHGENGEVILAEETPEAYREEGRFMPPDRPKRTSAAMEKAWAYPVVANGRLYIRGARIAVVLRHRRQVNGTDMSVLTPARRRGPRQPPALRGLCRASASNRAAETRPHQGSRICGRGRTTRGGSTARLKTF